MVKNIKQTGYELEELAELYGERGCCKKGTCIHKKAKNAIEQINGLDYKVSLLKNIAKNIYEDAIFCEEYMGFAGCSFLNNKWCSLFRTKVENKKMDTGANVGLKCIECVEVCNLMEK